jgi:hypothetical protein
MASLCVSLQATRSRRQREEKGTQWHVLRRVIEHEHNKSKVKLKFSVKTDLAQELQGRLLKLQMSTSVFNNIIYMCVLQRI